MSSSLLSSCQLVAIARRSNTIHRRKLLTVGQIPSPNYTLGRCDEHGILCSFVNEPSDSLATADRLREKDSVAAAIVFDGCSSQSITSHHLRWNGIFLPRSSLQAKPVQYSNAQNLLLLFLPQVNYSRKSVTSNSSEDTKITL